MSRRGRGNRFRMRKIILSTNIAETSLTIEGVRVVIDSGVARVAGDNAERGLIDWTEAHQ